MEPQTIKVSLQSIEIPAFNVYVHLISTLIVIFLIQHIFRRQISYINKLAIDKYTTFKNRGTYPDWIAHCRKRDIWPQKQEVLSIDLKGKYLKSLQFSVSLSGKPKYWRAGLILGNENLPVTEIVDIKNGITIHTGGDFEKKNKILPIWKYHSKFDRANPDFISVKSDDLEKRSFSVMIDENNCMKVRVQNELIFDNVINHSFRRKAYLKAWVDEYPDAKIKFKDISYSFS